MPAIPTYAGSVTSPFGFMLARQLLVEPRALREFAAAHLVSLPGDRDALRIEDPFHGPIARMIFAATSENFTMCFHFDNHVMNMFA